MANGNAMAGQAILTHDASIPLDLRVPALSDQSSHNGTIIAADTMSATLFATRAATVSTTLDTSRFKTVWDHDFSKIHSFAPELTRDWGNLSLSRSEATLTSSKSDWLHAGMMQPPTSADAGNGFGLYSATLKIDKNEGPGAYVCLWPATDKWPGPEIDLVEKSSTSNTSGYSTIHWAEKDPTTLQVTDQYEVHLFPSSIDVSRTHTYALDWEADHISLYIDKVLIYTTTQHVPADYAHGGQNEAFGAGMQPWGTQNPDGTNVMHVYDMSYATLIA